mgnify:CR=1 FL=1
MIALDEHQEKWLVEAGDPAWPAAQYLRKLGFPQIALPLSILLHGRRIEYAAWPTEAWLQRLPAPDLFDFTLFDQAQALEQVPDLMLE